MVLPDVNVWLAMTFESHLHHEVAKKWFETEGEVGCTFCRMTQQGFLRLSTNPSAFDDEALSLAEAWECYDALIEDPRVSFAAEPHGIEPVWRGYTSGRVFSPKVWNDAYLSAFARVANCRLVTLDKGFRQYKSLDCLVLE